MTAEQFADQLFTAIPRIEPLADEPAYIAELREFFERHSAKGEISLTESDDC